MVWGGDKENRIPSDDFAHVEGVGCPCIPQLKQDTMHSQPYIQHSAINAEPLLDNTFPSEWVERYINKGKPYDWAALPPEDGGIHQDDVPEDPWTF